MLLKLSFVITIILVCLKLCSAALPNLGERCYFGARLQGVCKLFSDCPRAKALYRTHGVLPQACAPHNTEIVVCCGDETPVFRSKSLAKCKEYSANCNVNTFRDLVLYGNRIQSVKDFPHMAKILYSKVPYDGRAYVRNDQGILISSRYVLSTAASVNIPHRIAVKVRLGALKLLRSVSNERPIDYNIENIIVHPNYQAPSLYNDIALIKLSTRVVFSEYIRPICLPDTDTYSNMVYRVNFEYDELSPTRPLVKYKRHAVSNTRCNETYTRYELFNGINHNFICTGADEVADSNYGYRFDGAPIMINHSSVRCSNVLLGISVKNMESRIADAALKIYNYRKWIEGIIWGAGQDP